MKILSLLDWQKAIKYKGINVRSLSVNMENYEFTEKYKTGIN